MEHIAKGDDGVFTVSTTKAKYRARHVILALGKTGSPRKLGVKGEDLPKVMYRLIEADHYVNKKILMIGGGDSAVEAAMGLATRSAIPSRSRTARAPSRASRIATPSASKISSARAN